MSKDEPLAGHARYKKLKNLNRGTFGQVLLAHDKQTDRLVAIKFIERGPKVSTYVERELINHRLVPAHPHIIKFKEVFLTPHHLGIVLEYADGGDCYDYVVRNKRLSEQQARWIFQQLMVAIDYMHKMGIANRDIKLENTLLAGNPERPLVKICDMGYTKSLDLQSLPDSKVGTPAYLAPEIITTPKGTVYDGKVADIWSCGVMLYVMLVGSYPFERTEDKEEPATRKLTKMIQRVVAVDYTFPPDVPVSEEGRGLLSRMLVADPSSRATLEEIQSHPWYRRNLPPGVADMNLKFRQRQCTQSEEEVRRIVHEAKVLPPSSSRPRPGLLGQLSAAALMAQPAVEATGSSMQAPPLLLGNSMQAPPLLQQPPQPQQPQTQPIQFKQRRRFLVDDVDLDGGPDDPDRMDRGGSSFSSMVDGMVPQQQHGSPAASRQWSGQQGQQRGGAGGGGQGGTPVRSAPPPDRMPSINDVPMDLGGSSAVSDGGARAMAVDSAAGGVAPLGGLDEPRLKA